MILQRDVATGAPLVLPRCRRCSAVWGKSTHGRQDLDRQEYWSPAMNDGSIKQLRQRGRPNNNPADACDDSLGEDLASYTTAQIFEEETYRNSQCHLHRTTSSDTLLKSNGISNSHHHSPPRPGFSSTPRTVPWITECSRLRLPLTNALIGHPSRRSGHVRSPTQGAYRARYCTLSRDRFKPRPV